MKRAKYLLTASILVICRAKGALSRWYSNEETTSLAVISVPLWNITPSRKDTSQTISLSSVGSILLASSSSHPSFSLTHVRQFHCRRVLASTTLYGCFALLASAALRLADSCAYDSVPPRFGVSCANASPNKA